MRKAVDRFSACVALAVLLVGLCWCPSAAALEIAVHGVADPASELLSEALEGDDDLLRYATPATPDAALGKAVTEATRLALQRQGYIDPAVNTAVESVDGHRRVVVDVVPGQRLTAGKLRIDGLRIRLWRSCGRGSPARSHRPRPSRGSSMREMLQLLNGLMIKDGRCG